MGEPKLPVAGCWNGCISPVKLMVGKIWDGMGYKGVVSYDGMVRDIALRSHIIADMVWVLNGMSHGMGYPWDVP